MDDASQSPRAESPALARLLLQNEVEAFLYEEAEALDRGEFERWLSFYADDCRYWVPIRRNVASRDGSVSDIGRDGEVAWFDDDKAMMEMRVAQIRTGLHWAEEPRSRVAHIVSNVRLASDFADASGAELLVNSRVLVHRSRMETETDLLVGLREDRLRRTGSSFQIVQRKVILNHHTLMAKNLSFFI